MAQKEHLDVWTYATANSVTTPGDLTSTYWPGMRVALKQGTLKYFVISAVVYSTPNTTITLDGFGTYTLTSATITAHIDSTAYCPKGFPTTDLAESYDVVVYQASGVVFAVNVKTRTIIDSGTLGGIVNTRVLRAAIAAVPIDGSLFIGPGVYDGLIADQHCSTSSDTGYLNYYVALPTTRNIHIKGAGIQSTILKLANGQHSGTHPALIMYAYAPPVGGVMRNGYTSFSLEDITFDGNKANQTIAFYDGAGLFLDGSMRYNGIFRNLEFQYSANDGCYFGYNGNGYANNCYYENIHSHDNAGAGINFDTVHNSIVCGLFSDNDDASVLTAGVGVYFMSADYQNPTWSDGLIADGIIIHNSMMYIDSVTGCKYSNVEITNVSAPSAIAMRLYHCKDIDIIDPNIHSGRAANHNAINLHDSSVNIRITGGYLNSSVPIYCDLGSSCVLRGVTLDSAFEIFYAQNASTIELLACTLVPTTGQYIGSVIDTSSVKAMGCSSSVAGAYYIESTANFTQLGCLGMGLTGIKSIAAPGLQVSLIPDRSTPQTYSVAGYGEADQGLFVNAYCINNNTYGYQRYIDLVALGYEGGAVGGSVLRFLTNSNISPTAVEAMRIGAGINIGGTTDPGAGNLRGAGNCSFDSFTDRTPAFTGKALEVLQNIAATKSGEIDHNTLPEFVQETTKEGSTERSIGGMVSVLVKGAQELIANLEAAVEERNKKIASLETTLKDFETRLTKLESAGTTTTTTKARKRSQA